MIRTLTVACAVLLSAGVGFAQESGAKAAPIVFFTIFGPDGVRLQRFYADVFAWPVAPDGTLTTAVTAPLSGQIGQDKDPAETIVYIGVPDVTATLAAVQKHGGTIHYPRFEVPGRVVLGVFKDPAGNRVGLVEMENGTAKIPKAK